MLADDVGAYPYGASTIRACLHSHSAPMSCSYFRYGAAPIADYPVRTYSNFTSTSAVYVAVITAYTHSDVVGKLPRAILSATVLSTFSVRISIEWLPDVFQKTKVTQKLS